MAVLGARPSPSLLALAACSGGGGSDRTASTGTGCTDDRVAAGADARRRSALTACPGFYGSTTVLQSSGRDRARPRSIDATAGGVGCLDRVEFTFRSLGDGTPAGQGLAPGYTVEYKDDGSRSWTVTPPIIDRGQRWLLVDDEAGIEHELNTDPTAKKVPPPTSATSRCGRRPQPPAGRAPTPGRAGHRAVGDQPRHEAPVRRRCRAETRPGSRSGSADRRIARRVRSAEIEHDLAEHRVGREQVVGLACVVERERARDHRRDRARREQRHDVAGERVGGRRLLGEACGRGASCRGCAAA